MIIIDTYGPGTLLNNLPVIVYLIFLFNFMGELIFIPVLQMRTLKHKECKYLAQGHTSSK